MIRPTGLHAEHHAPNTIGIGESQLRLSWSFEGVELGWKQMTYELQILWSEGQSDAVKVDSSQSRYIPWPWRPNRSGERCSVRVGVIGGSEDHAMSWSEWTIIETGPLELSDWECSLIQAVGDIILQRPIVFGKVIEP